MNKLFALWAALSLSLLGGCGGTAPLIKMPDTPQSTTEVISTTIKFSDSKGPEDNVVQLASHAVKQGSSVVINVPSSLFETDSEKDATNQEFKTKDFFNHAEQEIEKVFIHNGFRVLSRAKFEAKLRDLRDEARCDSSQWNCLRSQVSPESQAIMDDLKSRFDRKEISPPDYADQIKQFRDKLQTSSAGKTRKVDEKELTDISEVIRAAQSGDTRADYILQINLFDTKKERTISTDIRQLPDIREFVRKYPAIKNQLDEEKHSRLKCAIVAAELNAKLIHVKSGEIIWIGSYELNELTSGVSQLEIELGEQTYPANEEYIRRFVTLQNTELQRQARYNKEIQVPDWEYKTKLLPVTVITGKCDKELNYNAQTRLKLAREVAKGLISTIKVTAEQLSIVQPDTVQPENLHPNSVPPKDIKKHNSKKVG